MSDNEIQKLFKKKIDDSQLIAIIRRASYANIIYEELRCQLIHNMSQSNYSGISLDINTNHEILQYSNKIFFKYGYLDKLAQKSLNVCNNNNSINCLTKNINKQDFWLEDIDHNYKNRNSNDRAAVNLENKNNWLKDFFGVVDLACKQQYKGFEINIAALLLCSLLDSFKEDENKSLATQKNTFIGFLNELNYSNNLLNNISIPYLIYTLVPRINNKIRNDLNKFLEDKYINRKAINFTQSIDANQIDMDELAINKEINLNSITDKKLQQYFLTGDWKKLLSQATYTTLIYKLVRNPLSHEFIIDEDIKVTNIGDKFYYLNDGGKPKLHIPIAILKELVQLSADKVYLNSQPGNNGININDIIIANESVHQKAFIDGFNGSNK